MTTAQILDHLDQDQDGATARLFDLLSIPSISTDPGYASDCVRAAEWLQQDLASIGFEARVEPTAGHPMVVAHYRTDKPGAKHILFYGHYDVQPPDPLELWETPPFEPRIERRDNTDEGRIVARGAMDDKGQLMTFVEACRAWSKVAGSLPLNITLLFEGEEESGSTNLEPFLKKFKDELKADMVFVCDTLMWDKETPAITAMLRGMVAQEFTVKAASRDLHSGLYGNAAQNPINIITRILGELRTADGHVNLPGFYEGVNDIDPDVLAQWQSLGFSEDAFLGDIGLKTSAGEPDRHILEHIWTRPTCDVNGITGGYTGDGFKTVIPAKASAKLSFRLVSGQDPKKIRAAFQEFVRTRIPSDCSVEFIDHSMAPAFAMDTSGPFMEIADKELAAEFGKPTAYVGCGGSIPIVENFKNALGMDAALIGFGLEDDKAHSPNEKYEVSSFRHAARFWARLLGAL
ncbi:MAG: M20/M25/M40 family metallo-hydrolase [Alphaproteobacteria bacterium]|nr:MAG: M20/M25/M40 family metallo-hydrolase [Alphaproteobacteria bacterium]